MGDVIHAMPVVSDALRHDPSLQIDWLVEASFAELPAMHPGVGQAIPIAMRRWRKKLLSRQTWQQIGAVRAQLRSTEYDLVLDLQGLLKSALWTCLAGGHKRAGHDWQHAREPLASWCYHHKLLYDPQAHAIERLRQAAAQALGYSVEGVPRFGLRVPGQAPSWLPTTPYWVALHATSRAEKLYPTDRWVSLAKALLPLTMVLPWGNEAERQAAHALAAQVPGARVAERTSLTDAAWMMRGAIGVVGVDTGLTHLACALDRPVVALFAATPAWRYGPYGRADQQSLGAAGVWPDAEQVLTQLRACIDAGQPAYEAIP